jgi:hypothetical protein
MENDQVTFQPRRRTTPAQRRAELVAQFRDSNLTRRAFVQQQGISVSTLGNWLAKLKQSRKVAAPVVFSEFKLSAASASSSWAVEIVGHNGVTIRCRETLSPEDMAWLLRGTAC